MKWCPYCGRQHARRARACDPWCEKRIRGKVAAITAGRTKAIRKQLEAAYLKGRNRKRWREISMGRNVQLNLAAIFGPAMSREPGPLRHGDTLDAE